MVPDGWREARLGDVAAEESGRVSPQDAACRYLALEHIDPSSSVVSRHGAASEAVSLKTPFRSGDVLFGKLRPYLRKVVRADFDGVCSTEILVVRPTALDGGFLLRLMSSDAAIAHAMKTAAGTKMPRTSWSEMATLPVLIPPLQEQRRIAAVLQAADDAVTTAQAVIDQTEKVKRGLVEQLLTRGMPGRHTRFKMTEIGEVPESWEVVPLEAVADVCNGPRTPISAEERMKMKGQYPYFGPTKALDHLSTFAFDGEYVLIGEDGDHFLKFDRWNMTQRVSGRFSVNNHAHVLRGTRATNAWLDWFFRHRDLTSLITRQGANRYKLRKATLLELPVALPTLDEQALICGVLDASDHAVGGARHHLRASHNVRSGLSGELVTGRVRVPS